MTIAAGKTPYHRFTPGSAMSAEAIPFEFLDPAHLKVNVVGGEALTEGVHFEIGGDPNGGTGTIRALTDGGTAEWELFSETPDQQQLQLRESRVVPMRQYEKELDRAALRARENSFEVRRAPKVPRGEDIGPLPALVKRKGNLLGATAPVAYAAYDSDGNPTVDTPENFAAPAAASEAAAKESAAFAEEFSGRAYDTQAAGENATTVGQFFRVWNGDAPRTYTRYERTPGGSAAAAPLATTADLASPDFGKGAALVFSRLNSAAASRTVADRLADSISLLEYRLVIDANPNDVGLWLARAWNNGNRAFYLPYSPFGYNWQTPWDAQGFPIWFDGRGNSITLTGGGVTYLKNTGLKSDVFNLSIEGDRTPGQIFYEGMGATSLCDRIRVEKVDIGFKMTGGFEPVFDNIYGRNCRTALFHFADGVGPIVRHFTYDTDGPWYNGKTVASITRSGTTATVTTNAAHGFTSGQTVTIMGCAQSEYNGNFAVTVSSSTVFTYTVAGAPATPATTVGNGSGVILASLASSIFAMPSKGSIWLQTEGAVIAGGDSIHAGLVIEVPSYRNIEWALIGQVYFDSGLDNPGIQIINNTADKYLRGISLLGVWSATNTRGVHIFGTASNDRIDGIFIRAGRLHNNTSEAVQVDKGQNVFISGNDIIGNNASVFNGSSYVKGGSANQVLVGSEARKVFVTNNIFRRDSMRWLTTPNEHIYIANGATGAAYGNDCDGGTSGGFGIFNASGPSFRLGYNPGVALPNFPNDAAAASGGTAIGGWYRNGSALMERQS